jgi:hypothetical protein
MLSARRNLMPAARRRQTQIMLTCGAAGAPLS